MTTKKLKYRRVRREEAVIERLTYLRKRLKRNERNAYDRLIFSEAIETLRANLERDDERELFRLWELQDPRAG